MDTTSTDGGESVDEPEELPGVNHAPDAEGPAGGCNV